MLFKSASCIPLERLHLRTHITAALLGPGKASVPGLGSGFAACALPGAALFRHSNSVIVASQIRHAGPVVAEFLIFWRRLTVSSVFLGHQELQEGSEQTFAPDAGVVYKLKEAQVERQFFL